MTGEFHPSGYLVHRAPRVLDASAAAAMIDDLAEATRLSPYVAVDMSEVEVMTSAAVTPLLWARHRVDRVAGQLVLVAAPHCAVASLAANGAGDAFPIVDSPDQLVPRPGWGQRSA